jgi:hypothetical protein
VRVRYRHSDEATSEPHVGFVLDVVPEWSMRREARHLNEPRVWWRGGRRFGLRKVSFEDETGLVDVRGRGDLYLGVVRMVM